MAAECLDCDTNDWALCKLCGTPGILHYHGDDDSSTGPAVCVIVRYRPRALNPGTILWDMPCPMPALIAAFKRQDNHDSYRFRGEADHHADWVTSAMLPVDVEEAKGYDVVSELVNLGLMESRESGESSSQDHVAESAELSGESSSPKRLVVSAPSLVEQAASENKLLFHIVQGYLMISDYPSRVGVLGARFDSADGARKFWHKVVEGTLVECPCGRKMKIFNFSIDDVQCRKCRGEVSSPAGKIIQLSDRVLDAIKCKCGEKCRWLTEAEAKTLLRTTLDPNERREVVITPTPLPRGLPPRTNRWDEPISLHCVSPDCEAYFGNAGRRLDARMVECQLQVGVRDAVQLVCEHGGASEALLASDPTG